MREPASPRRQSSLEDTPATYGWISIGLHWFAAAVIIALWLVGKGIATADGVAADARRALHVSIAASAWVILAFRVAWRFRSGHPHVRGQSDAIHAVAKVTHYASLLAVVGMLVSGPVMVWARGNPIDILGAVSIPGPFGADADLAVLAHDVHAGSAALLFAIVLLHVGGALKHLMFHTDDTIVRMLWPARPLEDTER